jgi:hypothetical protein
MKTWNSFINPTTHLPIFSSIYLFINPPRPTYLSVHLNIYQFIHPTVFPWVYLVIYFVVLILSIQMQIRLIFVFTSLAFTLFRMYYETWFWEWQRLNNIFLYSSTEGIFTNFLQTENKLSFTMRHSSKPLNPPLGQVTLDFKIANETPSLFWS